MSTNRVGTIQSLPVSVLSLSARNVRKTGGQSIDELAASIKAQGLIHNLTVAPINGSAKFEVVAGGRRWRALRHLIKAKALPKDHKVPCRIVSADHAEEASLAENVIREAMHPADQFDAFKALVDKGMPIEDVAARFGVSPLTVKQRLKLANVAPSIIAQFRANEATLEQMMALAVTDDHAAQESAWNAREEWQREPRELRAALTEGEVDTKRDRRAKYVGIDAYEKAGGNVRRDLFSDTVYLTDAALLDRLAEEKLARAAARIGKEGWGWIEVRLNVDYSELHAFGRLPPNLRKATRKEQAELDALEQEESALQKECDSEPTDERYEQIEAALEAIEARRAAIEQTRVVDDAEAKAKAGALVYLGHDGATQVERGLLRREDRKEIEKLHGAEGERAALNDSRKAAKAEYSDALTRRLTAERTLALRAVLAEQPAHALTALVHALVLAAFYRDDLTVLGVTIRDEAQLSRAGIAVDDTKAMQRLHALHGELQAGLPSEAAELWAWIIAQDQATQLHYLAYCIAPSINVMQGRAMSENTSSARPVTASHALAGLIGLDMADWRQATAENFFGSVSKGKLVEAVRETKGNEAAARLEKMKKADAVAAASAAIEGTRWLPTLLRRV